MNGFDSEILCDLRTSKVVLGWWHIKQCDCLQDVAEAVTTMCLENLLCVKLNLIFLDFFFFTLQYNSGGLSILELHNL